MTENKDVPKSKSTFGKCNEYIYRELSGSFCMPIPFWLALTVATGLIMVILLQTENIVRPNHVFFIQCLIVFSQTTICFGVFTIGGFLKPVRKPSFLDPLTIALVILHWVGFLIFGCGTVLSKV